MKQHPGNHGVLGLGMDRMEIGWRSDGDWSFLLGSWESDGLMSWFFARSMEESLIPIWHLVVAKLLALHGQELQCEEPRVMGRLPFCFRVDFSLEVSINV